MSRSNSLALRWATLFFVVAHVVFSSFYTRLIPGPSIQEVSDKYANLFTPAGYAFAIWSVIYAAMIGFAVVALLPSKRRDSAYDRGDAPLLVASLMSSLWIWVFTREWLWWSVVVLGLALGAAGIFYFRAHRAIRFPRRSLWFSVPASLLFGWLVIAAIANVSEALVATGYRDGEIGEAGWTIVLLCLAGLLSLGLALKKLDFIVPAVTSWATLAIWVSVRDTQDRVAFMALGVAVVSGLVSLGIALYRIAAGRRRRSWA